MNIVKTSKGLTKMQAYKLRSSKESHSFKSAAGSEVEVAVWMIYDDVNSRDEAVNILAIMTPDGEVFAGQSETFKRSFIEAVDIFGDELEAIKVITNVAKNGREYVDCEACRVKNVKRE